MLLWTYHSEAHRRAGALPPEALRLPYGKQNPESPFLTKDYIRIWRAIEDGYVVQPADCPPIRLISQHGFVVRCPGSVILRRNRTHRELRLLENGHASFGLADIYGDSWPDSDSELVASWISGSEYVKIQTGIDILLPKGWLLYQGPLPNRDLLDSSVPNVMAGLEYYSKNRSVVIEACEYGIVNLNVIIKLPSGGKRLKIEAGVPLGWFFPIQKNADIDFVKFD